MAPDDPRQRLDTLRGELGGIDREILALVAKRQTTAMKIGQAKRELGMPTRDFRQEKDVVQRARIAAVDPRQLLDDASFLALAQEAAERLTAALSAVPTH